MSGFDDTPRFNKDISTWCLESRLNKVVSGKVIRSRSGKRRYYVNSISNCAAFPEGILSGYHHDYDAAKESLSWGYVGHGPDLTSIVLLGDYFSPGEWYRNYNSESVREKILPLYKQFTKDIVSKFGDEWSITRKEIAEWIKNQGSK